MTITRYYFEHYFNR